MEPPLRGNNSRLVAQDTPDYPPARVLRPIATELEKAIRRRTPVPTPPAWIE